MSHRTGPASEPSREETLTHREERAPALLAAALSVCVVLTACSTSEPEPEEPDMGGLPPGYVSRSWVEREVMLHVLDRMLIENEPAEDVEAITGSPNTLFEAHILKEGEDRYFVEFDKDAWMGDEVGGTTMIDSSLHSAVNFEEVAWCGEPVGGEEIVDAYMEEFWETLDSHEEYTASIADYVDCGDGTP